MARILELFLILCVLRLLNLSIYDRSFYREVFYPVVGMRFRVQVPLNVVQLSLCSSEVLDLV